MAEEETAVGEVADAEVTTLDLKGTTQTMDSFMEWTALTSGGVSTAKSLKRLGVMGA